MKVGITTEAGLKATAEIWGEVSFRDTESYQEVGELIRRLIDRAIVEKLPLETAKQDHVQVLYRMWQIPMYLLDLRKIDIPLEELRQQREAMLWAEIGY